MQQTSRLGLPLLAAAQAQKHVTHNEALLGLDALAQIGVVAGDVAAPPSTPAEGDCYHVGVAASGAFAGHQGAIAEWRDLAWRFHQPRAGWVMWVADRQELRVFDGTLWRGPLDGALASQLDGIGIGAVADTANPFVARLNAALWTARPVSEGGTGDVRVSVNKEASTNVASFVLQSNWSGRAEMGLVGSDDLALRVSPSEGAWITALSVDRASGALRVQPGSAAIPALASQSSPATGLCFPAAETVSICSGGHEALRVTSGRRVLIGTTTSLATLSNVRQQIAGASFADATLAIGRFSADNQPAFLSMVKSRASVVGQNAPVQNGDGLGTLDFQATDGSTNVSAARIVATADGAVASGDAPGRLSFLTRPPGGSFLSERVRISATGSVSFPGMPTTAAAANAVLDSATGNVLLRSTSSRRYKHDIRTVAPAEADAVLALRPVRYRSNASADTPEWSWYGLIAEDVAEVEPRLVHWAYADDQYVSDRQPDSMELDRRLKPGAVKTPDAVQYDRIGVLLIDVVRRQGEALAELASRLASLESAGRAASNA